MRVRRSLSINAALEKIFALINDFQNWRAWSPYETKDPAMARKLSSRTAGSGAVYEWSGNKEVGVGRMEIAESTPPSIVMIKLDFLKPFENHCAVEFRIEPKAGATEVAWVMESPSPYVSKLLGVFVDLDKMIGRDFEAGLAKLKAVAETPSG